MSGLHFRHGVLLPYLVHFKRASIQFVEYEAGNHANQVSWYATVRLAVYYISSRVPIDNNSVVVYGNPTADVIYGKPYCRIPAYLVGMVFGYIFYKVQGQPFKMNKVQQEDCKSV